MDTQYQNRQQAGIVLAEGLSQYANRNDVIVIALPRGGVPVAFEIATRLHAPLDVFIVRKLGVPSRPELAIGAIAPGGVIVFNEEIVSDLNLSQSSLDKVIAQAEIELKRREELYRGTRPFPSLLNKTVIVVDDGIATGATMRAAVQVLRHFNPAKIIIATPVAEHWLCEDMARLADEFLCPSRPNNFNAVSSWFDEFPQTTDEEVHTLLSRSAMLMNDKG